MVYCQIPVPVCMASSPNASASGNANSVSSLMPRVSFSFHDLQLYFSPPPLWNKSKCTRLWIILFNNCDVMVTSISIICCAPNQSQQNCGLRTLLRQYWEIERQSMLNDDKKRTFPLANCSNISTMNGRKLSPFPVKTWLWRLSSTAQIIRSCSTPFLSQNNLQPLPIVCVGFFGVGAWHLGKKHHFWFHERNVSFL